MYHHFNDFCYNYFLLLIEFIIIFYCYTYVVYAIFIVLHSYIQSCCMCMHISRCVMYALLYNIMNMCMYVCVCLHMWVGVYLCTFTYKCVMHLLKGIHLIISALYTSTFV